MMSRWRIFSELRNSCFRALLLAVAVTLPCSAAAVTGTVDLVDSRDPAVRKSGDRSGVVVWLERVDNTVPVSAARERVILLQKRKQFIPHVLPVRVGTVVSFPNADPIFHNAFSTFDGQVFDVGLYAPGTTREVVFRRPGFVRVFCNIHPTMSAVIVVVPTPWFAASGKNGSFTIENVPPGEYRMTVFHERATPETLQRLSRRVVAHAERLNVGTVTISEAGYLPVPHKNKFGHEYDPAADKSYIGVKQ
jgi:plastocyanin